MARGFASSVHDGAASVLAQARGALRKAESAAGVEVVVFLAPVGLSFDSHGEAKSLLDKLFHPVKI